MAFHLIFYFKEKTIIYLHMHERRSRNNFTTKLDSMNWRYQPILFVFFLITIYNYALKSH